MVRLDYPMNHRSSGFWKKSFSLFSAFKSEKSSKKLEKASKKTEKLRNKK